MTANELAEHLFDVANQFNRGAARQVDRDEKVQVATINLRAGRKAKASAAFASACVYLEAGMALLDERDWGSQYELMFKLRLERAECEFLTGNFETAEQLIGELLQRGASKVDQATAYRLKVLLHTVKSENAQSVASALTCLRLFGIDIPARPTWEQVRAEYEAVWQTLNGRPIESLIDLPLMTDPEQQAAMQVLSTLLGPAYFTDFHLFCLLVCRMVNVGTQHGMCGASAHAYGYWGIVLGPVFHRNREGYRSAKLACDLVEKHGFISYRAKAYRSVGIAALWTQPITTALDFNRAAFRAASETGDLTYACYSVDRAVLILLLRNDPLDAVWRESESGLDFAQKAGYGGVADNLVSQQRFIATMQGRTATFPSFSDAQFDEAAFEAQLMANRNAMMVFYYWILKLKARFLSGDYAEALAAADKAKALLWISAAHIHLLDYFYYAALTVAALYENGTADEQNRWRELLTAHQEQLREWAENCPPTFADKHALVSAEIARLEGRDADAMRLYEEAIHSAGENGFVQNEGLAHEVAARFYAARGVKTIAHACLREARRCYLRWGAFGKVRQLEQLHPQIRDAPAAASPTTTIGAPVERLDVGTVLKAAQAVSGEIVLGELIKTLLRIAVEHAGAERGLLILLLGDEPRIAAEATAGRGHVEVTLRQTAASPVELPESVFHYVIRTRESVILDDALAQNPFSADEYIRQKHARSVLCLPLVKQSKLIGVLYLENNLASHVFTPSRISVLELLASQAAISLENARLYSDLQEREARIRRLVDSNIIGVVIWDVQGRIIDANQAFLDMVGYGREDLVSGRLRWTELTPAEWRDAEEQIIAELKAVGTLQPREKEYLRKDGSRVPVLVAGALFEWKPDEGVSFVIDMTERKRAEEMLRASEQRYRNLFEQMPIAMWQVDGRGIADLFAGLRAAGVRDLGTYLDQDPDFLLRLMDALIVEEMNEHAIKMFGAQEQIQLLGPSTFFWQRRPDTFRRAMESRFRGLPTFQEETKFVTLDGREIDVLFTAARLGSIGERGIGLSGAIDITDRIRAQERLQQVQADFAHAARLSVLGEIAASIAHEINHPLAAVRTNGETGLRWLDRSEPNIPKARELMQRILNDADRAADIIARIRAMATGRAPQQTALALHDVIAESMLFLRHELQSKGVSVSLELAPALPQVTGDRTQLNQVIVNLVINAVQAMVQSATGRCSIFIRTVLSDPETVRCIIEDSGPGIDPTHLPHLFDSFFTTKDTGMGMGLSICRSIIEAHDGHIEADNMSALGGARFSFALPANRASEG